MSEEQVVGVELAASVPVGSQRVAYGGVPARPGELLDQALEAKKRGHGVNWTAAWFFLEGDSEFVALEVTYQSPFIGLGRYIFGRPSHDHALRAAVDSEVVLLAQTGTSKDLALDDALVLDRVPGQQLANWLRTGRPS